MNTDLAPHDCLNLYHRMIMIRAFEESAIDLFAKGLITGSTHPSIGQEAIAVGACSTLEPTDKILATYRGHGEAIAKGSDPKTLMAELLTRVTGCCKGRGGSMHLCDIQHGVLGTNAIVAAHIPIAGGVALANKLRNNQQVTLCFFGDGASCEGEFFESLNMSALWKLPLIFICENNGYAISVPTRLSQSTPDIADRARGFGIPVQIVDGNDLLAVRRATKEAVAHARSGNGPFMIECKTVRWERHSAFSAGKYENPEEAQRWKKVDPIPRFSRQLLEMGLTPSHLQAQEVSAQRLIREAVEFAIQSPLPSPDSVNEGVFAQV
ncbi:MAG: thiamine pyrophosphate-dependent dehydrogenase E1 component subunit alpha [Acidobacteriota bacterium]